MAATARALASSHNIAVGKVVETPIDLGAITTCTVVLSCLGFFLADTDFINALTRTCAFSPTSPLIIFAISASERVSNPSLASTMTSPFLSACGELELSIMARSLPLTADLKACRSG